MDPTTCYAELLEALAEHRIGDALEHAESLGNWLQKGGFLPEGVSRKSAKNTIATAYNLIPPVTDVTAAVWATVKELRSQRIPETDIRLQVKSDGWQIHTGDSSYDQDHRGAWGASSVERKQTKRDCRDTAADLINQIRE